jgi:hypothetical protein
MLSEVLLGELAQRDLPEPPVTTIETLEHDLQRLQRLASSRESAHLWPRRAASVDAMAIGPRRLAIPASRLQLEHTSRCCNICGSSLLSVFESKSRGVGLELRRLARDRALSG